MRDGDNIRLDTANRRLDLLVDEETLKERGKVLPSAPLIENRRGYERLYFETVTQAENGCDFLFAIPKITRSIP